MLAQTLVTLADTLVDDYDDHDDHDDHDTLVHARVELLPVSEAGLLLVSEGGSLGVMASTSEATRVVELFQLQSAQGGPCIDCIRTGEGVSIPDLQSTRAAGPSSPATPGRSASGRCPRPDASARRGDRGGSTCSGTRSGSWTRRTAPWPAGWPTSPRSSIVQRRSINRASLLAEQLQAALTSRVVIE